MTDLRKGGSVFDMLLARPRATGFGFRIPIMPDPPQVSDDLADFLGLGQQTRLSSTDGTLGSVAKRPSGTRPVHSVETASSGQQSAAQLPKTSFQRPKFADAGVLEPLAGTQVAEGLANTDGSFRQVELEHPQQE